MVAIDGPAGSGKSAVARMAAKRLGFLYIDTGAMYRAATLISMREGIAPEDEDSLVEAVANHRIFLQPGADDTVVIIDGEDVSSLIRTPELTAKVGPVCELPGIRRLMGRLQREMGEAGGAVLEGRDIGTVIFPDAEVKIYLDASSQERAKRRWKQLLEKGIDADLETVLKDLTARDERDRGRDIAPLKAAEGAVVVDTTKMSIEEVIQTVIDEVRRVWTA